MSDTKRWLHLQMRSELSARREGLLSKKADLQRAAAQILEIDELVEAIDAELRERDAKLAALPASIVEKADARPA